jgi:DNA-directed RNA polymerase specialized sigma24 family protein
MDQMETGHQPPIPWASLVERVRDGDRRASEELCAALAGSARARLHWGVDPQLLDDKLHDVLVSLLEAIRDNVIRDPERVAGFVGTLTRRRVSLHIRTNISRRSHLVPIGLMDFAAPAEESPEAAAAQRESADTLRKILRRVCARDREILLRFYMEEQDPERICREMGLSPTQFRLYKSRALARCSHLAGSGAHASRHASQRASQPGPAERRIA